MNGLFDIFVNIPAFLHRRYDSGKIIIVKIIICGLLGNIGSRYSHGTADPPS